MVQYLPIDYYGSSGDVDGVIEEVLIHAETVTPTPTSDQLARLRSILESEAGLLRGEANGRDVQPVRRRSAAGNAASNVLSSDDVANNLRDGSNSAVPVGPRPERRQRQFHGDTWPRRAAQATSPLLPCSCRTAAPWTLPTRPRRSTTRCRDCRTSGSTGRRRATDSSSRARSTFASVSERTDPVWPARPGIRPRMASTPLITSTRSPSMGELHDTQIDFVCDGRAR